MNDKEELVKHRRLLVMFMVECKRSSFSVRSNDGVHSRCQDEVEHMLKIKFRRPKCSEREEGPPIYHRGERSTGAFELGIIRRFYI